MKIALFSRWVVLLAMLATSGGAWGQAGGNKTGIAAESGEAQVRNATLLNVRGGLFRLRGKTKHGPLLLAFLDMLPESADSPSRRQIASLLSLQHQYGNKGLMVVAVDASQTRSQEKVLRNALTNVSYDLNLTFPLLLDVHGVLTKAVHPVALPTLLMIDAEGRVRNRWSGFTQSAILAQTIERLTGGPLAQLPPF